MVLTADAGTLWGLAYVLEGSRLGSRLLASRVRQAAWPGAATALCYLGHGDGLPLWPGFLRCLEAQHGQLDPRRCAPASSSASTPFSPQPTHPRGPTWQRRWR